MLDSFHLTWVPATGLISGYFASSGTSPKSKFSGVILQGQSDAEGFVSPNGGAMSIQLLP